MYERNAGMTLSHTFLYHLLLSLNACTGCTTKTCHHHTHTHTLLFDSPPAHCWKVVECFPNERIILKHAGDIEHNNMSSLLQDYPPPPPHQNRAFDPHPIKAFMAWVMCFWVYSQDLIISASESALQRICLALYKSQPSFYRAFTCSLWFGHEFMVDVKEVF